MTDAFYPPGQPLPGHPQTTNLADVLERVLDRGIVIAGDIQVNLLDIELLTIKLRLLVASVDRAREMGINWWESDPSLSIGEPRKVADENRALRERVQRLESRLGITDRRGDADSAGVTMQRPRGAGGQGGGEGRDR
jgi:hypothetical protein